MWFWNSASVYGWRVGRPLRSSVVLPNVAACSSVPSARKRSAIPRWSSSSIERAWIPPPREPARSGDSRRSRTTASTPASRSSPASIIPVGPLPTITTSCMSTSLPSAPAGALVPDCSVRPRPEAHPERAKGEGDGVLSQAAACDSSRRTFLPPVVMRTSFSTCAGAFFGVVSASQPLGSDSRMTLCQALATCL